jgi:hypothetical protein
LTNKDNKQTLQRQIETKKHNLQKQAARLRKVFQKIYAYILTYLNLNCGVKKSN